MTGIVAISGCWVSQTVGSTAAGHAGGVLIEKPESPAAGAAGASDLDPCLRRGVDRSRGIAGNGRAHLHRGLIPEAPVEAQGIRRDELHETLLPHAIVVIIGN